jgi:type I restriction enzyme, S subunit
LPAGWAWVRVQDIVESVSTIDPKRELGNNEFLYIDLGALEEGHIVRPQTLLGIVAPSRARQVVRKGDTLFSNVRVYLRNITEVGSDDGIQIASTAFCVLRSNAAMHPKYLLHFVRSQCFLNWLVPLQRGNSPPAVVDSDIKQQPIPLAPLPEQHRIVERIDALFTEIADGEAALAEARKGLDLFRRALLKAAVTGELTRDWREANRPAETGAERLSKIRARWPGKSSRSLPGRRTSGAEAQPLESLPRLPTTWVWVSRTGSTYEMSSDIWASRSSSNILKRRQSAGSLSPGQISVRQSSSIPSIFSMRIPSVSDSRSLMSFAIFCLTELAPGE